MLRRTTVRRVWNLALASLLCCACSSDEPASQSSEPKELLEAFARASFVPEGIVAAAQDGEPTGGAVDDLEEGSDTPESSSRASRRDRGDYWLPGTAAEESGPGFKADRERRSVVLVEPGALVVPLRLGPGQLRFGLKASGPSGATWKLRVEAQELDGSTRELLSVEPGALSEGESTFEVAVGGERERLFFLRFQLGFGEVRGRLEVRAPTFLAAAAGAASQAAPPPSLEALPERPDIVVILLDAARADHFGIYGYERETTPHIDQLAAESLVFRRAYSECPNTSCSIPNLATGLPFLELGETHDSLRMADEVTTLAEALSEAGYRTIGLSGNPNNSLARNSAQGFDEFHAMWEGAKGRDRWDPYPLSGLAVDILEREPLDRPLFLQLHYVPPHEPYAPSPAFNLFTNPTYSGPLQGVVRASHALRAGELDLGPEDVQHFVNLYDGNLRMADDAVSQVLEALRATGRLDRSLLFLVSDHGEAFFEHGRQGHNSTLFDEMLHIPFILRLPGGQIPPGVDTERLVALGDVVPTVLGRLGLEPAPGVVGVDLLATQADPDRLLFHRTHHRSPILAARTPRWKAIVRPSSGERMLFDLAADPAERSDLLAQRPLLYTGLTTLLREHRELAETLSTALSTGGDPAQLSDEDREMLRSLGYL